MRSARVLLVGGLAQLPRALPLAHAALFLVVLVVPSITQIVFFAYLGRAAGVEDDTFYVVGNAVVAAAVPCLFAMSQTISDERYTQTLSMLVVSPANRVALFLGRALPVVANGVVIAVLALIGGALLLRTSIPAASIPGLVVAIGVTSFACTGIGLVNAALGLRWRETAVLSNLILYFLLLFAGVNVPLDLLPSWLQSVAQVLPVTHGVEAARDVVAGESLSDVSGLLAAEALVGATYTVLGLWLLRRFEVAARRGASLEVA